MKHHNQKDFKTEKYDAFHKALAKILPRLRDVSMRDGQQSWDANRWTNKHSLRVLKYYDAFSALVQDYCGVTLPEQEVSGGGEYLQPARYLGENPFENLKSRKALCKHHPIMSLYRGRQAFGFMPVSDEVGYHAVRQSAALGNNLLRVFDMMNDLENLKPSIDAFVKVRAEQIQNNIPMADALRYEIAVCYISEPVSGGAMMPKDYAGLIVTMLEYAESQFNQYQDIGAFSECVSVIFKDYAGQCLTTEQTVSLISAARGQMDQSGYGNIDLNMHSHGAKPDILYAALVNGVTKVDTSIGELAGGPSHTDLRDMIAVMLQNENIDIADYTDHPILAALKAIEDEIAFLSKIHKPYRMPLDVISAEEIASHKIASGAASALWNLICGRWHSQIKPQIQSNYADGHTDYDLQVDIFIETLKKIYNPETDTGIWKDAGQFHTVTPGSTIAYSQALLLVLSEKTGRPLSLAQHNQSFKDLVMGRYGKNIGLEKGYGDLELRNAYLMESALKLLEKSVPSEIYDYILEHSGMKELIFYPDHFAPERENILCHADIALFQAKVQSSRISESIQERVVAACTIGAFPKKQQALEDVSPVLEALEQKHITFSNEQPSFGLSEYDQAALLLILLYTNDKGYDIGRSMFLFQSGNAQRLGDIEGERYGDIFQIMQQDIPYLIEDMAKLETLENIAERKKMGQRPVTEATEQGIQLIEGRFRKRLRKILSDLKDHGYGQDTDDDLYSLQRAKEAVRIFSIMKKDQLVREMILIPPAMWKYK